MTQKIIKKLINKMFKIAGYTLKYKDIVGVEEWFRKHTMTKNQCEEWLLWSVKFLQKQGFSKSKAQTEMMWFNLNYGLKIKL